MWDDATTVLKGSVRECTLEEVGKRDDPRSARANERAAARKVCKVRRGFAVASDSPSPKFAASLG